MMTEEFEDSNLLQKLNEEQRLIFDNIVHIKKITLIYGFVYFL
jgi:hypothetical protein